MKPQWVDVSIRMALEDVISICEELKAGQEDHSEAWKMLSDAEYVSVFDDMVIDANADRQNKIILNNSKTSAEQAHSGMMLNFLLAMLTSTTLLCLREYLDHSIGRLLIS